MGKAANQPVVIPAVGESVSEGVIASWLVTDGAAVAEGAPLLELETDKATLEVPAPASGVITITAAAGSEVAIGQQVASITAAPAPAAPSPVPAAPPSASAAPVPPAATPSPAAPPPRTAQAHPPLSPAVRKIAAEHNIDLRNVTATGKGGRITKGDLLAQTTPAAAPPPSTAVASPSSPAAPAPSIGDASRSVPLSRIRRRIAENLVRSKQQAAHLTTFNEIDMTAVSHFSLASAGAF